MSENRRSFLGRGLKVLAVAAPIVALAVAPKQTKAGILLRGGRIGKRKCGC